eukprot:CAMPEP_0119360914 /NCGR_PEP_ID=MMETSP1334-20130426/8366_1 /TAXON_ID=127549 /ORGANISM="Calcidiscus leptoporus, Strain RCC1130" /LENGTH=151 /DNA_ID=CAMNT_0007375819 /DNA_START=266 /DNA_END=718 /DNA_ORIENTATION=+
MRSLPSPPPLAPLAITCGPGTSLNEVTMQCNINCEAAISICGVPFESPSLPWTPPPSPPSPHPIPAPGMAVLDGWTGNTVACLHPGIDEEITTAPLGKTNKTIAVQCCRTDVQSDARREGKCRRYIGKSPDGCVGGSPPDAYTYSGAVARC